MKIKLPNGIEAEGTADECALLVRSTIENTDEEILDRESKQWLDAEDVRLTELAAAGISDKRIGMIMGRTENAISQRRTENAISQRRSILNRRTSSGVGTFPPQSVPNPIQGI
jgi:hypothetical protein